MLLIAGAILFYTKSQNLIFNYPVCYSQIMVIELSKTYKLDLSKSDDRGSLSGVASTYGNEDLVGDVFQKGAFSDWLQKGQSVHLLYGHDETRMDNILGRATFFEKGNELRFDAQIDLELPNGETAYRLVKKGLLDSVSVRGVSGEYSFNDKGGRIFKKVDLKELSLVPFPANPKALITAVKSINRSEIGNIRDFEAFLRESGFSKSEAVAIASKGYRAIHQSGSDDKLQSVLKSLDNTLQTMKGKR